MENNIFYSLLCQLSHFSVHNSTWTIGTLPKVVFKSFQISRVIVLVCQITQFCRLGIGLNVENWRRSLRFTTTYNIISEVNRIITLHTSKNFLYYTNVQQLHWKNTIRWLMICISTSLSAYFQRNNFLFHRTLISRGVITCRNTVRHHTHIKYPLPPPPLRPSNPGIIGIVQYQVYNVRRCVIYKLYDCGYVTY